MIQGWLRGGLEASPKHGGKLGVAVAFHQRKEKYLQHHYASPMSDTGAAPVDMLSYAFFGVPTFH